MPQDLTDYEKAKQRLHLATIPDYMPCREVENSQIHSHLESALSSEQGCCIYISGVPGTGKTTTVGEVMRSLKSRTDLPEFDFVDINGMKLTDPNMAYTMLWQGLTGKRLTPTQAEEALDKRFTSKRADASHKMCIAVIDELDLLVTKKQQVMYNFFDWPTKANSKLIVIAIANTMDLPERLLSNKVASRLGLTRVDFKMYTYEQLSEIIQSRIADLGVFDSSAVEFSARKVAAVSGDARRALDICRRAAEVAESMPAGTKVNLDIVSKVIADMYASSAIRAITNLSLHQKLFLYALTVLYKQSGLYEAGFGEATTKHIELCRVYNLDPPTVSELASICSSLGSVRILLIECGKADLYQRIQMLVSDADVKVALRDDAFMKTIVS